MEKNKYYLERTSLTWSDDSIRLMLTPGQTARNTYFYAQEAGYFKTEYPYFTEREHLDSFLIVYTISGNGILEYEGTTYHLSKGWCIYIHCDRHHLYATPAGEDWEFLWVHFNGNGALGYYNQFEANGFKPVYFKEGFFMESTLWRIIALNQKKDVTTELRSDNLLHSLVTEILVQNRTDDAELFFIPDYVKETAKYIDLHFKEELRLDDFAHITNRSKYYIAKEFKKYMGISVGEYIIGNRISYAKELLKYSDMTVGEIAYETGMNNVTHFINLFKARESHTPLAYRKKWKLAIVSV